MKLNIKNTIIRAAALAAVALVPCLASASIVGPYSANANTVYLYHFDEPSGSSVAANAGTAGYNAISFDGTTYAGYLIDQPTITTLLGASGYAGFGSAANITSQFVGLGVDVNGDGGFRMDGTNASGVVTPASVDRLSTHNFFGSGNVFTLEAMVNLSSLGIANREIICTDNSENNTTRGFQFRINSGNLEFNFIGVTTAAVSTAIPTTGANAFVANEWFHVALAYNGTSAFFYWTRMDPANIQANLLNLTGLADAVDITDPALLVIGNEARNTGSGVNSAEGLRGLIDEVRISNVFLGAQEMMFIPEPSTYALLGLGGLVYVSWLRRRK